MSRTIVKSPPELWAELSDPAALTRHLGELGEITITRLEPEREVAWEGERVSGIVALEPAGWGTRVTLEVAPSPAAAPPEVEPVAEAPAPDAETAVPAEPEAEEPAEAPAEVAPRGLLARLSRWWRRPSVAEEPEPDPEPEVIAEPEPAATGDPATWAAAHAAEEAQRLDAVLAAALEALGTPRHRPFSRG